MRGNRGAFRRVGCLLHPERAADGMIMQADHNAAGQQPARSFLLPRGEATGAGATRPNSGASSKWR
jgi:hypothetical protein